jgi:hypothetical protein
MKCQEFGKAHIQPRLYHNSRWLDPKVVPVALAAPLLFIWQVVVLSPCCGCCLLDVECVYAASAWSGHQHA